MQYEIYDKGGLMKKKRQNLELWMGELRDKVRKDGTISNKDIMLFFTEKNLGQDDLSAVYELLHESNIDINFDEDASDEDLEILEDEEKKVKILGTNKQALTKQQIFELLKKQGFTLSYSTVVLEMRRITSSGNECFIRQDYDFGDRLEYDFGEVKLVINGITKKYYIAVLSSPAGNFRWCYLYDNCKKDVFLDSHVKFFEMIGGVWKEVVYDNMRNVVSKFIGRNEKELNEDLVKMSLYYGFDINVTNAFSGNEKGYVEGSVKYLSLIHI